LGFEPTTSPRALPTTDCLRAPVRLAQRQLLTLLVEGVTPLSSPAPGEAVE
jgi:hypothetical protein